MGRFTDILPSSQQTWLHELARAEVHPDAEAVLNLGRSFDPQQLVEESSIDFLMELREQFTEYARIFNGYSENGSKFQELKLYSVAQTAADFMMFRNQIKLVVSNSAHGVIQLAFAQHVRGSLDVNGQMVGAGSSTGLGSPPAELLAQIGPFRDVHWTFQGERVTPEQVARFYFAEFIRASRDTSRTRGNNQALLQQIRQLLQEKGLEL
jgi:hypothetical protein